jgi:hypothetical protein
VLFGVGSFGAAIGLAIGLGAAPHFQADTAFASVASTVDAWPVQPEPGPVAVEPAALPAAPPRDAGALDISCQPACTSLKIDDVETPLGLTPVVVAPGQHMITVGAENGRKKTLGIAVRPRKTERLVFQLSTKDE